MIWIALNVAGAVRVWDPYPFILLNLVFSLQAAYAAPLILLAQASIERKEIAVKQGEKLQELLLSNTRLTEQTAKLIEQVELLARQMHGRICSAERQ